MKKLLALLITVCFIIGCSSCEIKKVSKSDKDSESKTEESAKTSSDKENEEGNESSLTPTVSGNVSDPANSESSDIDDAKTINGKYYASEYNYIYIIDLKSDGTAVLSAEADGEVTEYYNCTYVMDGNNITISEVGGDNLVWDAIYNPSNNTVDSMEMTFTTNIPDTSVTTPPEDEFDFDIGSINGRKYENTFIGLGCELPEDWLLYSTTHLMELNEIKGNPEIHEYKKSLSKKSMFFDFYGYNANSDNINIILEHTTVPIDEYYTDATIADMINMSYADNDVVWEYVNVSIDELECPGALFTIDCVDYVYCQVSFAIECENNYIAVITITADTEEDITEFLSFLYTI